MNDALLLYYLYVQRDGQSRALDEQTGIDTLGNMMESSVLSVNR